MVTLLKQMGYSATTDALARELNDLKEQQHEALEKAIYCPMTSDEVRDFEKRRDRIHQLSERLGSERVG